MTVILFSFMSDWRNLLYAGFALLLAAMAFVSPVPNDFDRYIYEALVRGRHSTVQEIYPTLKHETPRAEASTVLDSPEHLGQLEPLYAIRPIYIETISALSRWLTIQRSINAVSAASLFGIALVLALWTRKQLYCAMFLSWPTILNVARIGTPDALSGLMIIFGFWSLARYRILHGLLVLLASVWVRTDNVLIVFAALVWLTWAKKIPMVYAAVLAALGGGSVAFINHMAGNYGWLVLFRYSFIGGKYPADISPHLTAQEYLSTALHGSAALAPQLAPWILVGLVAWKWRKSERHMLLTVMLASATHFFLFPSGEARYFLWAFLLTGVACVRAMTEPELSPISLPGTQTSSFGDNLCLFPIHVTRARSSTLKPQ